MYPQPTLPNFPVSPTYFRDRSTAIDAEGRVDIAESEMSSDELTTQYAPEDQE